MNGLPMVPLTATTVSYTHLDVYKRQMQQGNEFLRVVPVAVAGLAAVEQVVAYQAKQQGDFLQLELGFRELQFLPGQLCVCLLYTSRCV